MSSLVNFALIGLIRYIRCQRISLKRGFCDSSVALKPVSD